KTLLDARPSGRSTAPTVGQSLESPKEADDERYSDNSRVTRALGTANGRAQSVVFRFETFRLAGPNRSLLGVVNAERQQRGANKAKSTPQAWAKNAKERRWRERAEAWDERQRQVARVTHEKEIEEMNRRHLQEAKALQSKAIQRLKALEQDQLSPADL